jgi:hypothetical protein
MEGKHMKSDFVSAAEALSSLSHVATKYSQKGTVRQQDAAMNLARAVMAATQAVLDLDESDIREVE